MTDASKNEMAKCEHCEGTGKTWSHAYQGLINRVCVWCKGTGRKP